jgi:hypothetical protein
VAGCGRSDHELGKTYRVLGGPSGSHLLNSRGNRISFLYQPVHAEGQIETGGRHSPGPARGMDCFMGVYAYLLVFYAGDNPADIFAADVLQVIGLSIWLSIPLLWLPLPFVFAITALATVLGQTANNWPLHGWFSAYVNGVEDIGYFPLALWLPYTYLGIFVGKALGDRKRESLKMILALLAGVLPLAGIAFVDPAWGYRHPRPIFVLFSVAITLWLMFGFWLWTERMERRGPIMSALHEMGLASLMIYVFHHLIGYRLFWVLGWVTGRSWRGQFGVFSVTQATIIFVIFLGLMIVVAVLWTEHKPDYFSLTYLSAGLTRRIARLRNQQI